MAEPVALAKWMVRFTFDDQDFFVVDPVRYATALGQAGLATYRSEVAKHSTGWVQGERSFAASYAIERLAITDRDAPTLVEVLGGDLTRPHQFSRVAEAMLELDDPDAALAWARRGIGETNGWQVAKLYDIAATIVAERGDKAACLICGSTARTPPVVVHLQPVEDRCRDDRTLGERTSAARLVLVERSPSAYVDALLADNDTAEAWTAAVDNPDWQLDERQWERLATARERDDPAASFDVFVRVAETALRDANKNAYRRREAPEGCPAYRRSGGARRRAHPAHGHLA